MLHRILIALMTLLVPAFASAEEVVVGEKHGLTIGEREREYYLYTPPKASKEPRPLVVVLHGGGGKPKNIARTAGFSEIAKRENFLVAYPLGAGRLPTWNAGSCCGYAQRNNVDDVAFIEAMIQDIRTKATVDEERIYATGMSNGAMMSYRLACEMGDIFTAIAPVAGAMNTFTCMPEGRPSVAIFHAIDDMHVLYNGGPSKEGLRAMFGKKPTPDASVEDAVQFWMKNNYCRKIPQTDRYQSYNVVNYFCAEARDVRIYMLNGGGHSWPGGQKGYKRGDEPLPDPNATEEIWKFFNMHPAREVF